MEINLRNESSIAEVKEFFLKKFPFLKLEFFYPTADTKTRYHIQNIITNEQAMLGEIGGMNKPGYVRIHENRTLTDVEYCFNECFGLYVQLFFKSGNEWIAPSSSDTTLAEQNRKGWERLFCLTGSSMPDIYGKDS
ncbi:MAG: hypothetical protein V4590_14155 [Bacteroidota bacterium]